jgi:hypothetical protein
MKVHDWRQIARHTFEVYLAALPGSSAQSRR